MSAARQFFTDIANAKRRMTAALTATPAEDDEMMGDFDDDIGDELADRESKPGPEAA